MRLNTTDIKIKIMAICLNVVFYMTVSRPLRLVLELEDKIKVAY